jgi:hypothetical protein
MLTEELLERLLSEEARKVARATQGLAATRELSREVVPG